MAKSTLTWGSPFTGYVSSVRRNRVPGGAITGDSADVFVDPTEGSIYRRGGSAIVGDTASANVEVTGLLSAKWGARPRVMIALDSPSLSGYPTHAVLYGKDTAREADGGEVGCFGQFYLRNGSTNQEVLSDYSTTHYKTAGGTYNQEHRFKVVPYWYDSGDGGYARGATELTRRFFTAGSRDVLQTQGRCYFPSLYGTPCKWNKRINATTTSDNQDVRAIPTGPSPPLWCPVKTATSAASADGTWVDGDAFYVSVLFQMEDGEYTQAAMPRGINATLASGLGRVEVGTLPGTNRYRTITYAIPIGPDGTVARVILRTPKNTLSAAGGAITAAPTDLRIAGIVRNNEQQEYADSLGNDAGLLEDDNVVRWDHVMPRRSRFLGTGDQRVIAGHSLPNACAIMLAPLGSNTDRDLNALDSSATIYGSTYYLTRVTSTNLELLVGAGGAITGTQTIALSGASIQDVVDTINATTLASNADKWVAQVQPGCDPTRPATDLCPTTYDVANCTGSGTTLTTSNSFDKIPLGYFLSGVGIPAGTYVVSKQSSTSITVNQATTAAAATVTFACNTGDSVAAGGAYGYMRAFAPSYPAMLYLKRRALLGPIGGGSTLTTGPLSAEDRQSIFFTVSSPGAAVTGISLAPNAWVAGNRRFVESRYGPLTGLADIEGAAVVTYTRGVKLFINVRGVNTGEDFDYRMLTINERRGACGRPVAGDGWAAYPTKEGVMAVDKNRAEKSLTGAIHNPTTRRGNLDYELLRSLRALESDSDDAMFSLSVLGQQLRVGYRNGVSSTHPDRAQVYDFSPGIDASGLEELFDVEGKTTYPWSAPYTMKSGPCVEVTKSDGPHRYVAIETNAGATGDGRVDEIDMASVTDNGVGILGQAYLATVIRPDFFTMQALRLNVEHFTTSTVDVTMEVYRKSDRAVVGTVTLPTSSGELDSSIFELPQNVRANGPVVELKWRDGHDQTGSALWKVVAEIGLADSFK